MATFEHALARAMNGCSHEFHYVGLLALDERTTLACKLCGTQALASEVAWMLAGCNLIITRSEEHQRQIIERREQVNFLAHAQTAGGVH